MKNNYNSNNTNAKPNFLIMLEPNKINQATQYQSKLVIDFSDEVTVLVNPNTYTGCFKSFKIYPIDYQINEIETIKNNKEYFETYSFKQPISERSLIQFCLDHHVFLVATYPRKYDLCEKIIKLRNDEKLSHFLILIKPDQFYTVGNSCLNKTATIGGTFHAFHKGHKEYIDLAFKFSDKVYLFITSDEYAKVFKPYKVKSFSDRKKQIQEYLLKNKYVNRCTIFELNSEPELIDFYLNNEISLSVVIPEYYPLFQRINRLKERNGLSNLFILIKQRTLTKNGFHVNSTNEDRFLNDEKASEVKVT